MSDTSALELFAEISIGLVGFAGVVSALGHSRLPPAIRSFRISALLLYSVVALGGSLLPIVLLKHEVSTMSAWLFSAVALAAAQVAILVWAAIAVAPLMRDDLLPSLIARVVFTILGAATLYLLYGILFDRSLLAAIYLAGIFVTLGLGVFHFVVLVQSIQAGDRAGNDV